MAEVKITAAPSFPWRELVETYLARKGHTAQWREVPPMPGAGVTVLVEVEQREAGDGLDRLPDLLGSLGEFCDVRSADAGADLARARRRITGLIRGDGLGELRRYERARERVRVTVVTISNGAMSYGPIGALDVFHGEGKWVEP